MKKAKTNTAAPQATSCPVIPIAVRLGQAWDAFSMTEELDRDGAASGIEKLRMFLEEAASFERARSMAGALVQVALAADAARALFDKIPEGSGDAKAVLQRLDRLLDSASLVLFDACSAAEYDAVRNTMNCYNSIDSDIVERPLKWLEDVPELAAAYRAADAAIKTA